MDFLEFLSGFYSALALGSGVFFLTSRKLRAPFREAYGWLSIYCAIENLLYFILSNIGIGDPITNKTVCVCFDTTTIPLITLVIATTVDQDIRTTPFSKHWKHVAMHEFPIVASIIICAFTQFEWKEQFAGMVMVLNSIGLLIYSVYNLVKYEKNLPDDIKGKRASVKWTWNLVALLIIEFVLYLFIGTYITDITYYAGLIAATCIATYFINKQSPIDTRQIFSTGITQDAENSHDASDDPSGSSLSRNDMKGKVKKFMSEHPKFSEKAAERARQKLTTRDIFLCILIIEGKHISEISDTLAISPASVEVARYRLRSKLNMNKGENLANVLKSFL